ncbi:sensor domain-containing diguanylate cyclase [Stutzerimonas azotifigens]|uniref:diguanylate cyclase n=1 Tax=Stutzerimonas azotifigens TaxID=291995 RepID=A0ABR5Z4G2_9GAMM|nr:diguanylate cyclase [Stutzerimonas azotifigens]MBA1275002.1 diguanylate cyclase [Stutzerimonas azotifigens]
MPIQIIGLLLCLLTAPGLGAAPLSLSDEQPSVRLAQQLEYLLPEQPLDFAEASRAEGWQPVNGSSLSLGRQPGVVWVRMALYNGSQQPDWRLLVEWPILDRIEARVLDSGSGQWSPLGVAGDRLPLSAWSEPARQPIFLLHLPLAETRWVYLQLQSAKNLVAPMQLLTESAYAQQEMSQRTLLGLFFGAMLAVLLYNLSLYMFTRDSSYAWYCLYLLGVVVYELALTGFGMQFLWPELGRPAGLIYVLSAAWSFFAATFFARVFLDIRHYGGWVLWANNALLGYWTLVLLLAVMRPQLLHGLGIPQVAMASCLVAFASAMSLWRRGNRSAPLFSLAWFFLIAGTAVHVAALQGVLPVNQLTLRMQTAGFFAEFILLSVALAHRINNERSARIAAQTALIGEREARLESQEQLLSEQARANEELERRVIERTTELQQSTLELAQVNAELTRLSNTDPLTQLANRRYCDQQLELQSNKPLAVLVIDIDHFKSVNDRYGHPVGDRCINAVADVLRRSAQRRGDLAARYGGEEFLVLLSDIDAASAALRAEEIRAEVASLSLRENGEQVPISVSIGLAAHDGGTSLRMSELIGAADRALYAAKGAGRNQVCCAA